MLVSHRRDGCAFLESFGHHRVSLLCGAGRRSDGRTSRLDGLNSCNNQATDGLISASLAAWKPVYEGLVAFVARDGINGFRQSIEARKAYCDVRKVRPPTHHLENPFSICRAHLAKQLVSLRPAVCTDSAYSSILPCESRPATRLTRCRLADRPSVVALPCPVPKNADEGEMGALGGKQPSLFFMRWPSHISDL
jgi:hypothetical protein